VHYKRVHVRKRGTPKRGKTVMLTLRVPFALRNALRRSALADHRTVNSLVVALLWEALYVEREM